MAEYNRGVSTNALDTTYIRKKTVKALENKLILTQFGTPGELPGNAGSTLRWVLDANITGGTPTDALTSTAITFATREAVNQGTYAPTTVERQRNPYGVFVPVRRPDLKDMPKGQMERLASRLAYYGRKTCDTLLVKTCDGQGTGFTPSMGAGTTTTQVSIGGGADATLEADDTLTAEDIALAVGALRGNDAEEFSNGMYGAVIHSGAESHIITDVSTSRLSWSDINKHVSGYDGQAKLLKGRVGAIAGCMVYRSNNISTTETIDTTSAYSNLVFAADAFGICNKEQMKPKVHINYDNSTGDPYRFYATVAFVFDAAPVLLDSNRVVKLYSAQ